jgi:hypothetical protein
MDLSIWKPLGSHREGGGCQSAEALLFRQRDRRNIHCGKPMARRQQHVLNSPDLPLNNVRGLGREDNPRLCSGRPLSLLRPRPEDTGHHSPSCGGHP